MLLFLPHDCQTHIAIDTRAFEDDLIEIASFTKTENFHEQYVRYIFYQTFQICQGHQVMIYKSKNP